MLIKTEVRLRKTGLALEDLGFNAWQHWHFIRQFVRPVDFWWFAKRQIKVEMKR